MRFLCINNDYHTKPSGTDGALNFINVDSINFVRWSQEKTVHTLDVWQPGDGDEPLKVNADSPAGRYILLNIGANADLK